MTDDNMSEEDERKDRRQSTWGYPGYHDGFGSSFQVHDKSVNAFEAEKLRIWFIKTDVEGEVQVWGWGGHVTFTSRSFRKPSISEDTSTCSFPPHLRFSFASPTLSLSLCVSPTHVSVCVCVPVCIHF